MKWLFFCLTEGLLWFLTMYVSTTRQLCIVTCSANRSSYMRGQYWIKNLPRIDRVMCAGPLFKNGPRTHPEPWTYLPLPPYNFFSKFNSTFFSLFFTLSSLYFLHKPSHSPLHSSLLSFHSFPMQAITGESISFKCLPHNHLIHFSIFPTFHPFPITPSPLHSPSFSLNPFLSRSLTFFPIFFIFILHTYPTYISIFATLRFFIYCPHPSCTHPLISLTNSQCKPFYSLLFLRFFFHSRHPFTTIVLFNFHPFSITPSFLHSSSFLSI